MPLSLEVASMREGFFGQGVGGGGGVYRARQQTVDWSGLQTLLALTGSLVGSWG